MLGVSVRKGVEAVAADFGGAPATNPIVALIILLKFCGCNCVLTCCGGFLRRFFALVLFERGGCLPELPAT
jgi:hypothetical protein